MAAGAGVECLCDTSSGRLSFLGLEVSMFELLVTDEAEEEEEDDDDDVDEADERDEPAREALELANWDRSCNGWWWWW